MYHIDVTVNQLPYVTFHSEVSRIHRFNDSLISSNRFALSKFFVLQGGVFEPLAPTYVRIPLRTPLRTSWNSAYGVERFMVVYGGSRDHSCTSAFCPILTVINHRVLWTSVET